MADIDVVPRHRSSWIWIVLAIVVIGLIIWALVGRTPSAAQLNPIPADHVLNVLIATDSMRLV